MVGEYDRFFGNPVDVEVNGVKFKMKPLTVADLGLMGKLEKEETRQVAIKEVLQKTLIPKIETEVIDKISLQFFPEILKKIMEVNGLNVTNPISSESK